MEQFNSETFSAKFTLRIDLEIIQKPSPIVSPRRIKFFL